MEGKINEILNIITFYCDLLQNSKVFTKLNTDCIEKIFQTCVYIENAVNKIEEEKKEVVFESHLKAWMLRKKKQKMFKCSDLKTACDKMLEFCLKEEKISNEIINELLKMYIQQCGSVRLETNINYILSNSMQANAILEIFKSLEFSAFDIEDEVLIACWEQELKIGEHKKVLDCLIDMFNKENITRLIDLAYKSEPNSLVNGLILEFFSKKLIDNHVQLYLKLNNTNKKIILKLLIDSYKFQISFLDATFYFGRKLEPDDEEQWTTDTEFSYDDLKNVIKVFLNGPEELYNIVLDRIKIAKALDKVWEEIEKDCIL